jgi:hypothetical protein
MVLSQTVVPAGEAEGFQDPFSSPEAQLGFTSRWRLHPLAPRKTTTTPGSADHNSLAEASRQTTTNSFIAITGRLGWFDQAGNTYRARKLHSQRQRFQRSECLSGSSSTWLRTFVTACARSERRRPRIPCTQAIRVRGLRRRGG